MTCQSSGPPCPQASQKQQQEAKAVIALGGPETAAPAGEAEKVAHVEVGVQKGGDGDQQQAAADSDDEKPGAPPRKMTKVEIFGDAKVRRGGVAGKLFPGLTRPLPGVHPIHPSIHLPPCIP